MIITIILIWLTGAIILYRFLRKHIKAENSGAWTVADRWLALALSFLTSWVMLIPLLIYKNNPSDKPAKW